MNARLDRGQLRVLCGRPGCRGVLGRLGGEIARGPLRSRPPLPAQVRCPECGWLSEVSEGLVEGATQRQVWRRREYLKRDLLHFPTQDVWEKAVREFGFDEAQRLLDAAELGPPQSAPRSDPRHRAFPPDQA